MTNQEIFDAVTAHLRKQGRAATNMDDGKPGVCRYRTTAADGTPLMCAVGCLIKDEHYLPEMEGEGVTHSLVLAALEASLGPITQEQVGMLDRLQDIHDEQLYVGAHAWESGMNAFARANRLTYTPVA